MSNKQKRWERAQKREREYMGSSKDVDWGIPHSLVYWKIFLHLDDIDGKGIEVGCGVNGIYRFAKNITGIDPIDFSEHSDNFIQGVGEELPFESSSVDFAICCNAIDHSQNPQQVMNEMFRVSSKIILWTYTYPPVVGWVMERIDKTHLFHFTEGDFWALLRGHRYRVIKKVRYTFFDVHMKYVKSLSAKLKLLTAHVLGVRGLCVHLEVTKKV